jgi:hypothetical protein
MKQQVQAAIDSVKGKYTEKRTGLFQVEGRHENGTVALSGRVLEKAAITDLRRAIVARVPNVRIDDSAVRVLRREPAVRRIVATNLTDLHAEPSFISELLTILHRGPAHGVILEAGLAHHVAVQAVAAVEDDRDSSSRRSCGTAASCTAANRSAAPPHRRRRRR